jgi:hypothetical protein
VATTDSDHDYPILRDLTRGKIVDGPNLAAIKNTTETPSLILLESILGVS